MTLMSRPARPYTEAMRARTRELIFAVQIASPYSRAKRAYARDAWAALDEAGQVAAQVTRADAIGEVMDLNDGLIVAGSIRWRGVISDNISEGDVESACIEGMMRALTRFDLEHGTQFSTYATTAIDRTVIRMVETMRPWGVGTSLTNALNRVRTARLKHRGLYRVEPTMDELVESTGLDQEIVRQCLLMPYVFNGGLFDEDDEDGSYIDDRVPDPVDTEFRFEIDEAVSLADNSREPSWRDIVGTPMGDHLVYMALESMRAGADHA